MTKAHPYSLHRWWQNFGFGIQSKTDFAFLHDVLRERSPYYVYDDMKWLFPLYKDREHKVAQLLFRVCYKHRKDRLQLVGTFNDLEQYAITKALGHVPTYHRVFNKSDNVDLLIIKDIYQNNQNIWNDVIQMDSITYDMVNLGIAFFDKKRYPEHYQILRP